MVEDTATTGSIQTQKEDKVLLALKSHDWNRQQPKFREVFPELALVQKEPSSLLVKRKPVQKAVKSDKNSEKKSEETEVVKDKADEKGDTPDKKPATLIQSVVKYAPVAFLIIIVYLIVTKLVNRLFK
jgi:hypothetical protein